MAANGAGDAGDAGAARAEGTAPDDGALLSVLFAAVEARAAAPPGDPWAGDGATPRGHLVVAVDAYARIGRPELEGLARAAVATLVPRVLYDAAAVRAAMCDDPAAPGLEVAYLHLLGELSALAAVCVPPLGDPPAFDECADAYRGVCAEITALRAAAATARPAWRLIRQSFIAARRRPPARRAPLPPVADDREYYL